MRKSMVRAVHLLEHVVSCKKSEPAASVVELVLAAALRAESWVGLREGDWVLGRLMSVVCKIEDVQRRMMALR